MDDKENMFGKVKKSTNVKNVKKTKVNTTRPGIDQLLNNDDEDKIYKNDESIFDKSENNNISNNTVLSSSHDKFDLKQKEIKDKESEYISKQEENVVEINQNIKHEHVNKDDKDHKIKCNEHSKNNHKIEIKDNTINTEDNNSVKSNNFDKHKNSNQISNNNINRSDNIEHYLEVNELKEKLIIEERKNDFLSNELKTLKENYSQLKILCFTTDSNSLKIDNENILEENRILKNENSFLKDQLNTINSRYTELQNLFLIEIQKLNNNITNEVNKNINNEEASNSFYDEAAKRIENSKSIYGKYERNEYNDNNNESQEKDEAYADEAEEIGNVDQHNENHVQENINNRKNDISNDNDQINMNIINIPKENKHFINEIENINTFKDKDQSKELNNKKLAENNSNISDRDFRSNTLHPNENTTDVREEIASSNISKKEITIKKTNETNLNNNVYNNLLFEEESEQMTNNIFESVSLDKKNLVNIHEKKFTNKTKSKIPNKSINNNIDLFDHLDNVDSMFAKESHLENNESKLTELVNNNKNNHKNLNPEEEFISGSTIKINSEDEINNLKQNLNKDEVSNTVMDSNKIKDNVDNDNSKFNKEIVKNEFKNNLFDDVDDNLSKNSKKTIESKRSDNQKNNQSILNSNTETKNEDKIKDVKNKLPPSIKNKTRLKNEAKISLEPLEQKIDDNISDNLEKTAVSIKLGDHEKNQTNEFILTENKDEFESKEKFTHINNLETNNDKNSNLDHIYSTNINSNNAKFEDNNDRDDKIKDKDELNHSKINKVSNLNNLFEDDDDDDLTDIFSKTKSVISNNNIRSFVPTPQNSIAKDDKSKIKSDMEKNVFSKNEEKINPNKSINLFDEHNPNSMLFDSPSKEINSKKNIFSSITGNNNQNQLNKKTEVKNNFVNNKKEQVLVDNNKLDWGDENGFESILNSSITSNSKNSINKLIKIESKNTPKKNLHHVPKSNIQNIHSTNNVSVTLSENSYNKTSNTTNDINNHNKNENNIFEDVKSNKVNVPNNINTSNNLFSSNLNQKNLINNNNKTSKEEKTTNLFDEFDDIKLEDNLFSNIPKPKNSKTEVGTNKFPVKIDKKPTDKNEVLTSSSNKNIGIQKEIGGSRKLLDKTKISNTDAESIFD